MQRFVFTVLAVLITTAVQPGGSLALDEVENLLRSLRNYRFSNVFVYRLDHEIRTKVAQQLPVKEELEADGTVLDSLDESTIKAIKRACKLRKNFRGAVDHLRKAGVTLSPQIADAVRMFLRHKTKRNKIDEIYVVTTRHARGARPAIIGLLVVRNSTDNLQRDLRSLGPADVYTYDELLNIPLLRGS